MVVYTKIEGGYWFAFLNVTTTNENELEKDNTDLKQNA